MEFIKLKKFSWLENPINWHTLKIQGRCENKSIISPRWDFSWYSERVFTAHFLFWSQFSSHEKGAKNILARVCAMANGSCLVLGQGYTIWTIEYVQFYNHFNSHLILLVKDMDIDSIGWFMSGIFWIKSENMIKWHPDLVV